MINPAAPTHPISAKQHSAAHQPSESNPRLEEEGDLTAQISGGSNLSFSTGSSRPSAAFELLALTSTDHTNAEH